VIATMVTENANARAVVEKGHVRSQRKMPSNT
jgi:hypothetical protein